MLQPLERDTFVLHHFFLFVVWNILKFSAHIFTFRPMHHRTTRLKPSRRRPQNITEYYIRTHVQHARIHWLSPWQGRLWRHSKVSFRRTATKQQETWETAALGSNAVFDGELDPPALMDGDRKKKKVSVTGRRVGETFRSGGYKDTHRRTQSHSSKAGYTGSALAASGRQSGMKCYLTSARLTLTAAKTL